MNRHVVFIIIEIQTSLRLSSTVAKIITLAIIAIKSKAIINQLNGPGKNGKRKPFSAEIAKMNYRFLNIWKALSVPSVSTDSMKNVAIIILYILICNLPSSRGGFLIL